jgi:hypothetical protein
MSGEGASRQAVSRKGDEASEPTRLDVFKANLLAPPLSEEEAMRLAVEELRAVRRERAGES